MNDFLDQISALPPQRLTLLAVKLKEQLDRARGIAEAPIAVIGVGCRFPGATDPEAFWDMLKSGREGIRETPAERWSIDEYFDPDPDAPGKMSARVGGFLETIEGFDPAFFGIAPREAITMDPQQRLLLEVSWEALEHAGLAPASLMGSRTSVYIGVCNSDYHQLLLRRRLSSIDAYQISGNAQSVASGRLSYFLGLQGPCMTIDTSCSASLVAIHSACQSLRLGESSLALAGGVNLICAPETSIAMSKSHMLAADGRCKTFDAAADGFSRGEGCGIVVLKRLFDAKRDGDRILAVVRGSAINQDGRSSGLTVPNGPAQESVIRDALAAARLEGSDIDYVEAHGTGTSLGDPIEVRALGRALGEGRDPNRPLLIGSVKTNIGHLESAAGVAGFIKVVLSLWHEAIPAHLNFNNPNPLIEWAKLPVAVANETKPWPPSARPRRAGVSSFGFSGTNAHVVLEEAPREAAPTNGVERPLHCLALSAHGEASLRELTRLYAEALAPETAHRLCDVANVAGTGRSHLAHRLAIVAEDREEARAALRAAATGESDPRIRRGKIRPGQSSEVVFVYTGAGAQYPGMGRVLYRTSPVFRNAIDRCDELLGPDETGRTLKSVLWESTEDDPSIHEIGWTQPAIFAIEYSLTTLWRSWGVAPAAVIGHSVGEYAAACAAGVFSLEDGLRLMAERGRLMQSLPPGGMMAALFVAIRDIEDAIAPFPDRVAIAAINAPGAVVISGEESAVETVLAAFAQRNVIGQRLFVSLAAHSPLVEPALDRMEALARTVAMSPPSIPIAWNLTGRPLPSGEAPDANYWRKHMREPVRFADGVKALHDDGFHIFLEVGPHPTLLALAQQSLPSKGNLFLSSMRRGKDDWNELLTSLADLHVHGVPVDFAGFDRPYFRRRVTLPTYPFERERYWAPSIPRPDRWTAEGGAPSAPEKARELAGHFYKIAWEAATTSETGLPTPSDLAERAQARLDQLAVENDFAIYDRSRPELDRLTAEFVVNALLELGFDATPGRRFDSNDEASRLHIAPRHSRLFPALLALLARQGALEANGAEYVVVAMQPSDPAWRLAELKRRFREIEPELAIVTQCGAELARVLKGEMDPLTLLFDQSGLGHLAQLYAKSPFARIFNGALADVLRRVAESVGGRALRILEIGAGTGGTTQHVLPELSVEVDYTFTDVSSLFLAQAKDRFKGHPRLRFKLLDIERSPREQGFETAAYDVVIASNAVHATADIRESLRNIGYLLAPSGLLLAVEGLAPEAWVNITLGLSEGWWRFRDVSRRARGPLLGAAAWREVLKEVGFADVAIASSRPDNEEAPSQAMLMALWPGNRRHWALFSDGGELGPALAAALRASGDSVELTEPSMWRTALRAHGALETQPWWRAQFEAREGGPVEILYLGALAADLLPGCAPDLASLEAFLLLRAAAKSQTGRVWLVTRGAQDVRGIEDVQAPDQAGLWGLGRTFGLERPAQWGGIVDLDPDTGACDAAGAVREATRDVKNDQSAWRDGKRWVPRLVSAEAPPPRPYPLRSEVSYLIAGGLGNLGLAVAEWMMSRGARHLVLVSRTAVPAPQDWPEHQDDQRVAALAKLRDAGVFVQTVAADAADEAAMNAVMMRFGKDWPPLGGIVNAAVKPTAAPLSDMPQEMFDATFRTKVGSHRLIESLSSDQPVAFFVDFSTTTAVLGSAELAHYAAANAVLDALACARRAKGMPALSVNWGMWDLVNVGPEERERILRGGLRPMATAVGLSALDALLTAGATRQIVADANWPVLRSAYESRRPQPMLSRVAAEGVPALSSELPGALPSPADLILLPRSERRAAIEEMVRRDVADVVGLRDPQSIDVNVSLFKMGVDSLMAIQLQRRLERMVAESLPSALIFNYPTVEALVGVLESRATARQSASDAPDVSMDLLNRLDEMSGAQIDSLLNEMLSEGGIS